MSRVVGAGAGLSRRRDGSAVPVRLDWAPWNAGLELIEPSRPRSQHVERLGTASLERSRLQYVEGASRHRDDFLSRRVGLRVDLVVDAPPRPCGGTH